jgi:putative transposase
MLKSYKYRIYPTQEQKELLSRIFGQVRFVYNLGLETKPMLVTENTLNVLI